MRDEAPALVPGHSIRIFRHRQRMAQAESVSASGPGSRVRLPESRDQGIKGLARSFIPSNPKPPRHGCPAHSLAIGMDLVLGNRGFSALGQNLRSCLSAGMGGQLRGCEMATSPAKAWHPHFYPTRADTVRYRSGNMGVHIHEAKRTTFIGLAPGKTATVTLVASGAALDPAAELSALLLIDPARSSAHLTALWRIPDTNVALTTKQVRAVVQRVMAAAGLNPLNFGAHSLRLPPLLKCSLGVAQPASQLLSP